MMVVAGAFLKSYVESLPSVWASLSLIVSGDSESRLGWGDARWTCSEWSRVRHLEWPLAAPTDCRFWLWSRLFASLFVSGFALDYSLLYLSVQRDSWPLWPTCIGSIRDKGGSWGSTSLCILLRLYPRAGPPEKNARYWSLPGRYTSWSRPSLGGPSHGRRRLWSSSCIGSVGAFWFVANQIWGRSRLRCWAGEMPTCNSSFGAYLGGS